MKSLYPETSRYPAGGFAMRAPAKINLALRILGQRSDGYHELATLFQEISLADRLDFHPAHTWSLAVHGSSLDAGDDNLITRAARALAAAANVPLRGKLVLTKQIPVGGGMGGGSSNAAIALLGLNRLWNLGLPLSELFPLAVSLGSDCAFFLTGGLSLGTGRGEEILPLEGCQPGAILVVVPPFGISTASVYDRVELPLTPVDKSVILSFRPEDPMGYVDHLGGYRNDLENIVLQIYPELVLIRRKLLDSGASIAMVSGSGSALFGIFEDPVRAKHAALQFGPPLVVTQCHAVARPRTS